jgi:dephospho-CoA kinase
MRLIGLTGSIACGKSTVAQELARTAVPTVDLDDLGHPVLLWPGTRRAGAAALGRHLLRADGSVDCARLSEQVFASRADRHRLNALIQPRIALALAARLLWHFAVATPVVVLDAPLLFETGLHRICAATVAVHLPEDVQLERLRARDAVDADDARRKMAAQMSSGAKAARATLVIENAGTREELRARVATRLVPWLKSPARTAAWQLLSLPGAVLLPALLWLCRRAISGGA